MGLSNIKVGLAIGGSHCNMNRALSTMRELVDAGADLTPILSGALMRDSTRFGTPEDWWGAVSRITGKEPLTAIPEVEPFGPQRTLDVLLIAPCTGNTLAKLANAVTDSAPLMAAKAQLRNGRPVVVGLTTNDALGLNAQNLARLLVAKNIYFVPFGQDSPHTKPTSLVSHFDLCPDAVLAALEGRQLQPLLRSW